jgi:sarcosine oxidase delta subunit
VIVAEALEPSPARGRLLVGALGSGHHYIPPQAHTWQSDVETVHRLQEDEFFDRESVAGRAEFWAKLTTCWRFFNIARPNRNQQWKTPLQILRQRNPKLDLAIASWRPLDLAAELRQYFPGYPPKRSHNLPVHP